MNPINPKTAAKVAEINALYCEIGTSGIIRSDALWLAESAGRYADYWQSLLDDRRALANLSNYVGAHEAAVITAYRTAEARWPAVANSLHAPTVETTSTTITNQGLRPRFKG